MQEVKPLPGYGTIRSTAYPFSAVEALRWEKQYRDWHADDYMISAQKQRGGADAWKRH